MQTHLSFRKEKQSTSGKRWDRTKFAESGRRIDAGGGRGQGKGKGQWSNGDDDGDGLDENEDDDDDGQPLVPLPKPLVDPCE